jgi:hypothetical protein
LDFSGLNNLYGMNFASDFGGGAMGGIYPNDPNLQYISAPLSNKGNATSQTGGNTFAVRADQPVRLVDHRTNQIVFEGSGFDAARKATELGQGLTDEFGRKANYSIQTADPTGNYSTVAYEKKNKSTLGTIGDVVGTALPLATMFIPGLNVLGTIAAGAGLGGAGAALKGDNILKGAAMGGLSAAGGQVLGPALEAGGKFGTALAPKLATAVGTGLGSTAGGLVTGQSLENSLLGGVASGALSYVAPDIVKGLKDLKGPNTGTGGGSAGAGDFDGINVIGGGTTPGFSTTNINLGGYKTPEQKYARDAASDEFSDPRTGQPYSSGNDADLINVTGSVPGAVSGGLTLGGSTAEPVVNNTDQIVVSGERSGAVTGGLDLGALTAEPVVNNTDQIIVSGERSGPVTGGLTLAENPVVNGVDQVTKEIVATAPKVEQPTTAVPVTGDGFTLEPEVLSELDKASEVEKEAKKRDKLGVEEYLRLLALVAGLADSGGKSGSAGRYTPGGRGLNPIFSAKLPSAGGLGVIGANRTLRPMGDVDWLTYGTRPELNFFDYANPAPITKPIPNEPGGPIMAADRPVGTPAYGDYSMYHPDYRPGGKYGPSMDDNSPVPAARGGSFTAKRGGPSRRTEFAVNGPGTGRSDDIPAVLSDGEYVIDAETVALLGDGSSKAGAKKLDDLRVKVRKHKGQKLAKGRFSANAKKPEAYLSGGRI